MPIRASYVDEGRGVDAVFSGEITPEEMLIQQRKYDSRDESTYPCVYFLFDLSEASFSNYPSEDNLRHIAKANINPQLPHAFAMAIVAKESLAYGLARMWQILGSEPDREIEIFGRRKQAVGWLKRCVRSRFGFEITLA